MSPEFSQTYFENPDIWNPVAWRTRTADLERARLADEWLPDEVKSVLDVGCGNGVFTNIDEPKRFKVGLDLSRVALDNVTTPRLQSNAGWLPFLDNTFDATLSMEMLEHLPVSTYEIALTELVRVSRRFVLITVPFNEKLQYNNVVCPACMCTFHPFHHIRQYKKATFEILFGSHCQLLRLESVVPTVYKFLPALWNQISAFNHWRGRNFPAGIVCPQCGFTRTDHDSPDQKVSRSNKVRHSVNRLWPQHKTYTWWMALYQKVT
jgi:ubiquinone/menaquinone biosynthesis C-methylase UbiE